MEGKMIIKKEVKFNAQRAQVWKLLTKPEYTRQYMFGSEVISDWHTGSSIIWKGKNANGEEMVFVKGNIINVVPCEMLTCRIIDPNASYQDIPENYISMTYQLQDHKGGTLLTITQQDFEGAANGKKRYEDSLSGWDGVIPLMKKALNES